MGDVWSGPDWRIECGDCLELLKALPSGSVDAVVTDPPYSSGGMMRGDRMATTRNKYQRTDVIDEHPDFTGDNRDQRAFAYWVALWLCECRRIVKPSGMLCQFTDWRQLPTTTDSIQAGGWVWRGIVPWDKVQARPTANRFRAQCEYMVWGTNGPHDCTPDDHAVYGAGCFRHVTEDTSERVHSTQKPVDLMAEVIDVATTKGDTILDPFMGSATTGVACLQTGRKFIGFELDRKYCEIGARRLADVAPLFRSRVERNQGAELFAREEG